MQYNRINPKGIGYFQDTFQPFHLGVIATYSGFSKILGVS